MIAKIFLSITLFVSFLSFAEERPFISTEELNIFGDLCPKDDYVDGLPTKFNHTVVLVDTTSGFGPEQFTIMDRLIFDEKQVLKYMPYDRLSILHFDGVEVQAAENKYIFTQCRPRNGKKNSPHKLDKSKNLFDPVKKLQANWNIYLAKLKKAKDQLRTPTQGNFTQLIEHIKELSRIPDFNFDDSYQSRKLIIVSDLLQYSDNLNFDSSCRVKQKCISWNTFKKNKKYKEWIIAMQPDFGDRPIEVEIVYLNSASDPKLTIGLKELWQDYFSDIGIDNIKFEFDTST